ncbi:SDR family oxidoreductase [Amycolatopsis sp. FDAARGOS 1241]|uniref:SDR family oxidoreductase n=1 Tax=Amycolatopsis sp. FDAARGOS 1241 TaxID=2778070 RepID=UPI002103018F|nr:SDR family oxidoreductase [Amycolatopsis sp. FDAARGOS 1241]
MTTTSTCAPVTGGAGDIGREAVRQLTARGHHVFVADVDADDARRIAAEAGGAAVVLDVGDPGSWTEAVRAVETTGLPLTSVVLSAGVALGEVELRNVSPAAYRRAFSVNVDGVAFGLRVLVPLLAEGCARRGDRVARRAHGRAVRSR